MEVNDERGDIDRANELRWVHQLSVREVARQMDWSVSKVQYHTRKSEPTTREAIERARNALATKVIELRASGDYTIDEVAAAAKTSKATVCRILRERGFDAREHGFGAPRPRARG